MAKCWVLIVSLFLAACGGGGGGTLELPQPARFAARSGVAQKGPLILGSDVTAQELDSALSPTGAQYTFQTNSNLGTFVPTSTFNSRYIGLSATGYYFDEVANDLSTGPITLRGYSDLGTETVLNVNLLTSLAFQRIQHLVVSSHVTFAEARAQAEREVLLALGIPPVGHGSFSTFDLAGGTDGDHILAAVSSMFVYGNTAGSLSLLIARFQNDLAPDGVISDEAVKFALTNASQNLDPVGIAENLTAAYSAAGISFTAADIAAWLDREGNGVVQEYQFEVPDAHANTTFNFPEEVIAQIAGTPVSVTAGELRINGAVVTGPVTVQPGATVGVSPGPGAFPNGVLTTLLMSGTQKVAAVSFVSGLESLAVDPASPEIANGLRQQFSAIGTFTDASSADLTVSVAWTSDAPGVVSIDPATGLAKSHSVGTAVITATSGSLSAHAQITVTPAQIASLVVSPSPLRAGIGVTRRLAATGTYTDGTSGDVTALAEWTSGAPQVATVGPTTGVVAGQALGDATITARVGSVTAEVQINVVSNVWTPGAAFGAGRTLHTATLLPDGRILIAGGADWFAFSVATCGIYDAMTDTWKSATNLTTARHSHTATLLPDGRVLVAGGHRKSSSTYGKSLRLVEIYDPSTDTWTPAADMRAARAYHAATLLPDGRVLVTGGEDDNFPENGMTAAEIYDPVANTWTLTGFMDIERQSHSAILLPSGRVLVAGGDGNPMAKHTAEIYDPVTGTWSRAAEPGAGTRNVGVLLPNGKVMITGVVATQIYDPLADSWSTADPLYSHLYGTITLLPDGKVLLAGNGTAELYDSSSNTWAPTGGMTTPRVFGHTATLAPNGMVFVFGGSTSWDYRATQLTATSELYW